MSSVTNVNNDWYDGKAYQVYALEYTPGIEAEGSMTWFVGEDRTWTLDGRAISANKKQNKNQNQNAKIGPRAIPKEPMTIITNLGMGTSFSQIDNQIHNLMPAYMRIDYIRIYQDLKNHNFSVTCDPPGMETTRYIKDHENAYLNSNFTTWYVSYYTMHIYVCMCMLKYT